MPVLDPRQLPKNVAVGWSQACNFWRGASHVCPAVARFDAGSPGTVGIAVSGGWLSGTIGTSCAGSDSYATVISSSFIEIDIWKALANALWTSSVSFTVWGKKLTAGSTTRNLEVGPGSLVNPPTAAKSVLFPYVAGCPSTNVATATFYDDGTFSLA